MSPERVYFEIFFFFLCVFFFFVLFFFFQAEDGIRDFCLSRGLGDVYKKQLRESVQCRNEERPNQLCHRSIFLDFRDEQRPTRHIQDTLLAGAFLQRSRELGTEIPHELFNLGVVVGCELVELDLTFPSSNLATITCAVPIISRTVQPWMLLHSKLGN